MNDTYNLVVAPEVAKDERLRKAFLERLAQLGVEAVLTGSYQRMFETMGLLTIAAGATDVEKVKGLPGVKSVSLNRMRSAVSKKQLVDF